MLMNKQEIYNTLKFPVLVYNTKYLGTFETQWKLQADHAMLDALKLFDLLMSIEINFKQLNSIFPVACGRQVEQILCNHFLN